MANSEDKIDPDEAMIKNWLKKSEYLSPSLELEERIFADFLTHKERDHNKFFVDRFFRTVETGLSHLSGFLLKPQLRPAYAFVALIALTFAILLPGLQTGKPYVTPSVEIEMVSSKTDFSIDDYLFDTMVGVEPASMEMVSEESLAIFSLDETDLETFDLSPVDAFWQDVASAS